MFISNEPPKNPINPPPVDQKRKFDNSPPSTEEKITTVAKNSPLTETLSKKMCSEKKFSLKKSENAIPFFESSPPIETQALLTVDGNEEECLQINDQIQSINRCLLKNKLDSNILRLQIDTLVKDPLVSSSEKMVQLGLLLYFLDRDRAIPQVNLSYLMTLRSKEIEAEVTKLEKHWLKLENRRLQSLLNHEEANELPSGKDHYMLLTLASMILTSDQRINKGAIIALNKMLTDSNSSIPLYFKEEHRKHILIVANQLLNDPRCEALLEQKITPHATMSEIICLDLKVSRKSTITSVDTIKACLMALLFDVRQSKHTPNCFLVAPLIFMIQHSTHAILAQMLEGLKTGHFYCQETVHIPLKPHIDKWLISENELQIKMKAEDARHLTPFQHVINTIETHAFNSFEEEDHSTIPTLEKDLLSVVKAQSKEDNKITFPYALQLINSFKENAVIAMLLTQLGLHASNPVNDDEEHSKKQKLTCTLFEFLDGAENRPKGWNDFSNQLSARLHKKIWFVDASEKNTHIDQNKIRVGPSYDHFEIEGDLETLDILKEAFQEACYILALEGNDFNLIKKISHFQQFLQKEVEEVIKEGNFDASIQTFTMNLIHSKELIDELTQLSCKDLDDNCTHELALSEKELQDSNLLLFAQEGGQSAEVLKQVFKTEFTTIPLNSENPSEFLCLLKKSLETAPTSQSLAPIWLIESEDHAFTLDTERCKFHLNSENDLNEMLNNAYQTADTFFKQPIPLAVLKAVIDNLPIGDQDKNELTNRFRNNNHTYHSFQEFIIKGLKGSEIDLDLIHWIIDQEFNKVTLTSLHFLSILEDLKLDSDAKSKLTKQFKITLSGKRAYPFQLSRLLSKLLIRNKLPIIDPYIIEQAILKAVGLPPTFDVGDLNSEDHTRLIIRLHASKKIFEYFGRRKKDEVPEKQEPYQECTLFSPQYI